MKRGGILLLILLTLVSVTACAAEKSSNNKNTKVEIPFIRDINSKEAVELIKDKDVVIVDIRTPEEYNSGYIKGALNIDYYSPEFSKSLSLLDKEKTYFFYCRSGRRSGEAKKIIEELGFKKVYNLSAGINEWNANKLPLEITK